MSEQNKQQVIALGRLGWSLRRIQRATGVRRETAATYLRAAGIAFRPPGNRGRQPPAKPANEAITDSEAAKPAEQISPDPSSAKPASEVITDFGAEVSWRGHPAAHPTARSQPIVKRLRFPTYKDDTTHRPRWSVQWMVSTPEN